MAWKEAWKDPRFRIKTLAGSFVLIALLASLPFFFTIIEQREGSTLNDWLLKRIPPVDVSVITFIIIWGMTFFICFRSAQKPAIFVVMMLSLVLLLLSRMLTIWFIPLNPPEGLIPLKDPISSIFYGGTQVFITKDLFYSGHTSTQFLIFLCLERKKDKILALAATLLVGMLVLIQHVHYTIDVVAAFVLTYFIYLLGRKIASA